MATISFDLSLTLVCARTRRCRAAKADTIWTCVLAALAPGASRGFSIDGDDLRRGPGQAADPGRETLAEGGRIQCGEDITQMIVARRAVGEGQETPQQIEFLVPEPGDVREPLGTRQRRKKRQQ